MSTSRAELAAQLRALDLGPGDTVMLHASLRAVGPVEGGADGLIDALLEVVGPDGRLLSLICADPDQPFDPGTSPAWDELGTLAEVFRRRPEVVLNAHPVARFGAIGNAAAALVEDPPLDDYYGPGSPLERLWAAGGKVLRLGADPDTVTLLHWAEYRVDLPGRRRARRSVEVAAPGGTETVTVDVLDDDDGIFEWPGEDYFACILRDYLEQGETRVGPVGAATAECLQARPLVDFAVAWMERNFGFPPPVLDTPRLRLRRPTLADADTIFERYATDPEVSRYMTWSPHADVGVTREWFEGAVLPAWRTGRGERGYVICLREDPRPIGMLGVRDHYGVCLGYVLARAFWGMGFMSEAIRAVAEAALATPRIHRVWAFHDLDNVGSGRALEKAGFTREGVLRRWCVAPALGPEPRDCVSWSRVGSEGTRPPAV